MLEVKISQELYDIETHKRKQIDIEQMSHIALNGKQYVDFVLWADDANKDCKAIAFTRVVDLFECIVYNPNVGEYVCLIDESKIDLMTVIGQEQHKLVTLMQQNPSITLKWYGWSIEGIVVPFATFFVDGNGSPVDFLRECF